MIPEFGYAASVAGLLLAVYGSAAAAVGAHTGRPKLLESSEWAATGVWVFVTGCMLLLVYAFPAMLPSTEARALDASAFAIT